MDLNSIEIKSFKQFMLSKSILEIGVALVIGSQITELASTFVENILSPVLQIICSSDKTLKLDFLNFKFYGTDIYCGKFMNSLLKFIITMVILYYILKITGKLNFDKTYIL
jgi:large conductance mechanosensitive channel protein